MKNPKSIKGLLHILCVIATEGNGDRTGEARLTKEEYFLIGAMIADIQNNLGEMREVLEKYNLKYPLY